MNNNNKGHEARGNKGGSRGENEKEREQLQREQAKNSITTVKVKEQQ
jgi:hypothetical protein